MKKNLLIAFVFISVTLRAFADPLPPATGQDIVLRVLISDDKECVYLALKHPYTIYAMNIDKVLIKGGWLSTKIIAVKDGLEVDKRFFKTEGIRVKVEGASSAIYVGGRKFRGEVDIVRKDNGKLMVINHIDLEEYLYGVLYHEVSHRWPMEVLKAQAIAARTFALYQARQNKLQPYDLRSDIYSQVYGGSGSEKWSTTMAVNRTKGKVLTYNADLLPAYYHATCAGSTEDAASLWNVDIPPLKTVACDFCKESPHYSWSKEIPLWTIETKLRDGGYKIGKISSFSILSRNKSGRVDKLEIKDTDCTSVIMTGKDFRQMMGPNELRSTRFDACVRWSSLAVEGKGWGHGVGMCQWGAFGQARAGKKCEEILDWYYHGTEITTIDKLVRKI